MSIIVTSELLERHSELYRLAEDCEGIEIRELSGFVMEDNLVQASRNQGQILKNYLNELRPTHVVLLHFDMLQLPLAFGLRFAFPISFSGIYFRPFLNVGESTKLLSGFRNYIQYIRKRCLFSIAIRNPHLRCLFSLDPYFIEGYGYHSFNTRILPLSDGIEIHQPSLSPADERHQLGVEHNRKLVLFFGSLAKRKGIFETLDALGHLAPNDQRDLCLALVGSVAKQDQGALTERLKCLESSTDVQFIKEFRFVSDEKMVNLFSASDIILLPYVDHAGSSGVLVRAAHAGKPVLGNKSGLIGRYIHDYGLGLAVECSKPSNIAEGLTQWLKSPQEFPFDSDKSRRFADQNRAKHFSEAIFGEVYQSSSKDH